MWLLRGKRHGGRRTNQAKAALTSLAVPAIAVSDVIDTCRTHENVILMTL